MKQDIGRLIASTPEGIPYINETDTYIECVSIIGTKLFFNLKLLPIFFRQIDIWLFIVSFILLMVVLDPTDVVDIVGYWKTAEVWSVVAILYVGFTVGLVTTLYFVLKNTRIRTVILPFVSLAVLSALISLGTPIEKLFIGDLGTKTTTIPFQDIMLCFIVEQVFSTLYVSMGFPLMMQRLEHSNIQITPIKMRPTVTEYAEDIISSSLLSAKTKDHDVKLSKTALKVTDICAASAEEHYVRIQTATDQELIRERFSQLISELPAGIGFQIHRSHWVAFAAVENILQNGAQHSVILRNGDKLPISKARKRAFKEALLIYEVQNR
ncbi:MAG: LytTR family DNA-binding domain-containing protein [Pseudoruegeria sp.]